MKPCYCFPSSGQVTDGRGIGSGIDIDPSSGRLVFAALAKVKTSLAPFVHPSGFQTMPSAESVLTQARPDINVRGPQLAAAFDLGRH